jgi:hypothetical protein
MRRPKDRADVFAETGIVPVIAAAFETYPELDVTKVLELCLPALAEGLRWEFRDIRRSLNRRNSQTTATARRGAFPGKPGAHHV